ncbi:pirin family protein [Streptomyces sp. AM8-1-1]|uniref:pirin family protein n=1 Tax=Streptomyces sp. AM8-1-1 TaxID=3075825 RepID=UPI0028C3AD27|nr:pirin family protein [Streptomyces sp. AM8-1-1]WNO76890.1 pirin family protein [Streptomyces sp. AM8-1-1]
MDDRPLTCEREVLKNPCSDQTVHVSLAPCSSTVGPTTQAPAAPRGRPSGRAEWPTPAAHTVQSTCDRGTDSWTRSTKSPPVLGCQRRVNSAGPQPSARSSRICSCCRARTGSPHRASNGILIAVSRRSHWVLGVLEHGDNIGHVGALTTGGVRWMTAGHGIIHRELPFRNERAHILQLWVNLPREMKMVDNRYQDLLAVRHPVVETDGVRIDLISGEAGGIQVLALNNWPISGG